MKALQPEGIRIRPSETVVVRIGKPMRLENAAPRCRTASNSGKHKTSASKHRLFGRNFKQATEKSAVFPQADTAQGKHRCYRPLPCRTSAETNKRPSENIFQTAFPDIKEAKGSIIHRRRVRKDKGENHTALLRHEPAFGLQNH